MIRRGRRSFRGGFGALVTTLAIAIAAGSTGSLAGCKRKDDGTSPTARTLPALVLRDDTPDLLLTWVDGKGDFHTGQRVDEVPEGARDAVRVVVTTRDEGAVTELVYVANLTAKRPDGTYPVETRTRAEWDRVAEARRAPRVAEAAPNATKQGPREKDAPPGEPTAKPNTAGAAVVYGAAWCKPCHDAEAYLKRKRVPVVYKDIEEDPEAGKEMQAKLVRAGLRGGQIPVLDVAGKILIGFDPRAVDAALSQAGGTAL